MLTRRLSLTGLMGKTDAEQLKTEALVIQATEFREKYLVPMATEKDPDKVVSTPSTVHLYL